MREELVELTTMCMLTDGEGNVLVQERPAHWPGLAFPGGHVEKGETMIESAIREVREETGLTMIDPRLVGIRQFINGNGNRYIVFLYRADTYSGTLRDSEEGMVRWVPLSEITEENSARGFMSSLRLFREDSLQEMIYEEEGGWRYI